MIQINLIPDVKQEMIRAQRMRNTMISFSILAGMIALGVVGSLIAIYLGQLGVENLTQNTIKSEHSKLSSKENINYALTIQNQLSSISQANKTRTKDSRLLDIIAAINPKEPNNIKFSKITLDPTEKQILLEGSAQNNYEATEVLKKTVQNTTIMTKTTSEDGEYKSSPLANDVEIRDTSYGVSSNGDRVVRFTMAVSYPDGLFDNTFSEVRVKTPEAEIDVTDSKQRVPDSMFSERAKDVKETN